MAIPTEYVGIGKTSVARATALNAVAAIGESDWIDISGCPRFSVHVSGITSATVVVTGSNAPTIPAAATHGIEISTVTVDSIINVAIPLHWVKVRCSVWASGTISAWVEGVMP